MNNDLKEDMESLKNLIQEMIPNGKKVVDETHDENQINVNHVFIYSNVDRRASCRERVSSPV